MQFEGEETRDMPAVLFSTTRPNFTDTGPISEDLGGTAAAVTVSSEGQFHFTTASLGFANSSNALATFDTFFCANSSIRCA